MSGWGPVAAAALSAGSIVTAQAPDPPTFDAAQAHFYNARYDAAAAMTLTLSSERGDDLATCELRSSSLLFQLKRLLESPQKDKAKDNAVRSCPTCPAMIDDFLATVRRGQDLARARLAANPDDETAQFFLGKIDLNYVWLQLGPLHKRTGWDEYWEARRSLDAVLKRNPKHVRAKVARAWIAYIVDTRMPWGTRWVLGGGDRKQALADVQEAVGMEADFYTHAEAEFALWNMLVRDRDMPKATEVARRLSRDFSANTEVAAFLAERGSERSRSR